MSFITEQRNHLPRRLMICIALLAMSGCGGSSLQEDELPGTQPPIAAEQPSADAGSGLRVLNSTLVQLDGSASRPAAGEDQEPLHFQWRQRSGPAVGFLADADAQSPRPQFISPSVESPVSLEWELTVTQNGRFSTDHVTVDVEPCAHTEGELYGDCIAPGFGPFTAYESSAEKGQLHHHQGEGDHHVQWRTLDTAESGYGEAVEVTWNANDPLHASAANGWFGIAAGGLEPSVGMDLSAFSEGTLSFDMRLIYHEAPDNPAPFIVKMECGWPCSSEEVAIPGAESSYEWKTYRYSIASMVASGLDIANVTFPLIVQPLWQQQEQTVTLQIDNVRLASDYSSPPPQDGCPKAGAIRYTLARSNSPSADEQDAYARIARAMDEAVRQYNCYTGLQRTLNVSYNPAVATADGNPNGSIRFGSRASMNHVTAMHEISHVLGVGASAFRNLVRDGVYHGAAGNAQLQAISGVADDRLRSDGTHFWPHGLNYVSEGENQQDLIHHCLVVEAIVSDL